MNSTEEQLEKSISQIYEGDDVNTTFTNNANIFTFELNPIQLKILSMKLPQSYIIRPMSELTIQQSRSKSKQNKGKVDSLQLINTSNNKLDDSILNSVNNTSQTFNRLHLREKKPKLSYDHKYPDLEAPISGMKFKTNNEGLKKCWRILQQLKKHTYAQPFLEPVDPLQLNIPDYLDVIKEPMDLSTIEKKFKSNQYQTVQQFYNDIRKIWQNSWQYNQQGSEIYMMTTDLSNYFQKLYKEVDKNQAKEYMHHSSSSKKSFTKENFSHSLTGIPSQYQMQFERFQRQVDSLSAEIQQLRGHSGAKLKKSHKSHASKGGGGGYDKPLTTTEKRQLGASIRKLAPEYLKGVWEIVSSGTNLGEQNKEELEFDIDTLPVYKARELERYVKAKLLLSNKQKKKRGKSKNKNELSALDNMEESQIIGSAQSFNQLNVDKINLNYDSSQQKQIKQAHHEHIKIDQFSKSSDSSFITDSDDSL